MMDAPILRQRAEPIDLVPVGQSFCFDMTIHVEMVYGQTIQQGFFLNTTDGYIGFSVAKTDGSAPIDMIMPEIPEFNFMVFGFKGNAYRFYNEKNKQGQQEHWVSSGNTDMHKYQLTDALTGTGVLRRNNAQKSFCDGKALATSYKLPGQQTIWYMYGDRYPPELHVQKFFGGFGVGVVRCTEGVYMLMEMEAGRNRSTIKNISQVMACFNSTGYKIIEDEYRANRRLELTRERERIERHAASAQRATTCRTERTAIVDFERAQLQRQEEDLEKTSQGNTYQSATVQKAYTSMMDPLTMVQASILEMKLSICQSNETLRRGASESAQARLACRTSKLARLTALEQQMRALDRQYATDLNTALGKKSQLMLEEMKNSCE
jgi:hypothetical protein